MLNQGLWRGKAQEIAKWFLQEAPLSIRVNTRRISVEDLQQSLGYPCTLGETPGSLNFLKRYPLQSSLAFRQGLFEIQDESSQKITLEIPVTKQDRVLDFCAGAGGKSLILAEKARHVVLHDCRQKILQEAKHRLLRAGLRNFSIQRTKSLKNQRFSLVVVDAPCSGSGVFRRHPEKENFIFTPRVTTTFLCTKTNSRRSSSLCPEGRKTCLYYLFPTFLRK